MKRRNLIKGIIAAGLVTPAMVVSKEEKVSLDHLCVKTGDVMSVDKHNELIGLVEHLLNSL